MLLKLCGEGLEETQVERSRHAQNRRENKYKGTEAGLINSVCLRNNRKEHG
jgi:hypothetical protein